MSHSNVLKNIRMGHGGYVILFIIVKTRELEKIVKGFANHRRIQILSILQDKNNLSVFEIADELNGNFKTISEHLRRLASAGLVVKRNMGSEVEHSLSKLGGSILKFLRTLE